MVAGGLVVVAGPGGGGQGQEGVAGGAPAHPVPLQAGDGDDGGLAVVAVLWEWPLAAAVVGAGLAQGSEGGGVAAGFGGEVAAVAEHVSPPAERLKVGGVMAAEVPGGADEPLEPNRQLSHI